MGRSKRFNAQSALSGARDTVVRPDFRRAIICGALALAAPGVAYGLGGIHAAQLGHRIGFFAATGACLLFGVIAVRSTANEIGRLVQHRGGPSAATALRLLITLVGYLIVLITVLGLLDVPIGRLVLSGAITGVIVGIAAQQSLGNAFAGLVLMFSKPFSVGEYITLRSGSLGGQFDGEVTAITLMYTVLETEEGPITIPNSGALAAATGRRQRP